VVGLQIYAKTSDWRFYLSMLGDEAGPSYIAGGLEKENHAVKM
jgi:hypothetical protein